MFETALMSGTQSVFKKWKYVTLLLKAHLTL
jgi:hypothetical protein